MKQDFNKTQYLENLKELEAVIGDIKELTKGWKLSPLHMHRLEDAELELSSVLGKLSTEEKLDPAEMEQQLRKAYEHFKVVENESLYSRVIEVLPEARSSIRKIIREMIYKASEPSARCQADPQKAELLAHAHS